MQILHVVRDLDLASGGPSISIPTLALAIARSFPAVSQSILFQDRGAKRVDTVEAEHLQLRPVQSGIASSKRMCQVVKELAQGEQDLCIHLHGLWSPSLHWVARFARKNRIPYVLSPRGMLSQWCLNHHYLRKRLAWNLYQAGDLDRSSLLHATSESEADDILAVTKHAPVVVVSNGCDLPPDTTASLSGSELYCPSSLRMAVAISRMHPVKGLQELMTAWGTVRPQGWHLAIVGPDENDFRAVLEKQRLTMNLEGKVSLHGAVDSVQKWAVLAQTELFILPSKSENFGQAIAEALASGTPVITTTGTPWEVILKHGCGWWVEPNHEALEQAVRDATSRSSAELKEMGTRGRELIEHKFSWASAAIQMHSMYGYLLKKERLPALDFRRIERGSRGSRKL